MSFIAVNLYDIYKTYFQPPYRVDVVNEQQEGATTALGIPISSKNEQGREVFLPVTLWVSDSLQLRVDCCTVRVTGKKNIIRTPVSERKGTVKEQYHIDDYQFTIKGVLIGTNGKLPDDQMTTLREIFESEKPVELRNALAELFMDKSRRVAIESLEFPEQEGKTMRHRPFVLVCESDFVYTLEL